MSGAEVFGIVVVIALISYMLGAIFGGSKKEKSMEQVRAERELYLKSYIPKRHDKYYRKFIHGKHEDYEIPIDTKEMIDRAQGNH